VGNFSLIVKRSGREANHSLSLEYMELYLHALIRVVILNHAHAFTFILKASIVLFSAEAWGWTYNSIRSPVLYTTEVCVKCRFRKPLVHSTIMMKT
jgi:hypothetical protein